MKRLKSGAITFFSFVVPAFVIAIATPEGAGFLGYIRDLAVNHGVPTAFILFGGVLLSEIWKAYLNSRKIANAGFSAASARVEDSLY